MAMLFGGLGGAVRTAGSWMRGAAASAAAAGFKYPKIAMGISGALGVYGLSRLFAPRSRVGGAIRGAAMYGAPAYLLGGGPFGGLAGGLFGAFRGVRRARMRSNRGANPFRVL